MATTALSTGNLTLVDLAKRTKDGAMIPIVEALQQKNSFLQSMVWKEGNTDLGHIVGARNSLPSISWVRLNEGVLPSKSTVDTYSACTWVASLTTLLFGVFKCRSMAEILFGLSEVDAQLELQEKHYEKLKV